MEPDLRLPRLLQELDDRRVRLRLENGQLHVEHGDRLTAELCDEVSELRAELVAYLRTDGEEVIDEEEKQHSDMRTLPRTPEEVDKQRAAADRERERARRRYQGGAVVINDNSFGHYMTLLVRERERREAVARGELPPQGYYQRKWDIFG
jgi:tubulysin polyketide synthase-like protein